MLTQFLSQFRAKWEQPDCLRAIYGLGDTRNGFHGSGEHTIQSTECIAQYTYLIRFDIFPRQIHQILQRRN